MTFFYDLNKKLSDLAARQTLNEGKGDGNLANNAKPYDKVTRGDVIAGRLGKDEKGGKQGVAEGSHYGNEKLANARASRTGTSTVRDQNGKGGVKTTTTKTPANKAAGKIRADKAKAGTLEEETVDEGIGDMARKVGGAVKQVAGKAMDMLGHGSDEDLIRDMQKQAGLPQTGKKPEQKTDEAAKYRDAKYKDKLYTQEPRDYDQYDYGDDDYYNPKPADYPGEKRKIGGSEFDHNDPLRRGDGIGRSGIKNNILDRGPRKGLPSRDQITSLKGSIKSAKGTHAEPNLPEAGAPMTAKQKSFAALAEPKDKITFADKIAGAKKEVDEMLGDVAAEAMKNALGGGKKVVASEEDDNNPFTNWKKPRAERPKVGSVERGALHDIEHTATGRKVTRRVDPNTGNSVGSDDDKPAAGEKRGRGRPAGKGAGKSIGAKGPSGKSKLMTKEGEGSGQAQEIYNELAELRAIAKKAQGGGQMPPGFASRLESSLWAAMTMIKNNQPGDAQVREEELDEKAVSKKQQKFMGMVHAAQKGEKAPSKEVAKVAKTMKKGDAEDFAATKHKGLPEKKKAKKEEVEETTTSGSVAVGGQAPSDPGAPKKEKASKGSMQFGKGVYEAKIAESFNSKLTNVLNEGMSINMSIDQEGRKNLTVTATDDDAEGLADLLKMAGLGGQGHEACGTCGESSCGCDQVDETLANSADNTEYADTDTMVNTLSGGLNGRKSTGQTTAPIVNRDPSRGSTGPIAKQVQEDAEQRLWAIYNRYSTSNK